MYIQKIYNIFDGVYDALTSGKIMYIRRTATMFAGADAGRIRPTSAPRCSALSMGG